MVRAIRQNEVWRKVREALDIEKRQGKAPRIAVIARATALAAALTGLILGSAAGSAYAQRAAATAPAATTDDTLAEVVVSARKRNERLIDVPVAVVALTAENLETLGIHSLADLARSTPGLSLDSTIGGSGRNDRSFNEYVIRGMVPALTSNPTTSIFIDGAPFVSGQISGLDDLARVEVLEGPQSAYFGRQTFAGAINLITRDPANAFGGAVSALGGSHNWSDIRASLEGPLFSDSLTARVSLRNYSRDGSWDNQALAGSGNRTLGDQSTKSATLSVVYKPSEDFKIKALGMYWEDDDGPGAQALYRPAQSNCRLPSGYAWYCGSVGAIPARQPAANTQVDSFIQGLVAFANSTVASTGAPGFTVPNKFGLKRKAYHWSVGIDYHIAALGASVSTLTSADSDQWGELQDLDNADTSGIPRPVFYPPTSQTFYNFPFWVGQNNKDFSQELRLASDADRKFRWLVGANYGYSRLDQALGGLEFNLFFGNSTNVSNNTGVFVGLAYDVTNQFTVNLDARWQRDQQSVPKVPPAPRITGAFTNYVPRLSLQYKFSPDVMGYFTYSQGVNPGTFNAFALNAVEANYIATNLAGVFNSSIIVEPEKLKNYELGLKGQFLDRRLTLAGDVYYDIWTNQITVSSFLVPHDTLVPPTVNLLANRANNGKSRIAGLELNVDWIPLPNWLLHFGGAINDSKIQAGTYGGAGTIVCGCQAPTLAQQTFNGNQLPNTSKIQFGAAIQYGAPLSRANWNWYTRLEDNYKSKQFESQNNIVSAPKQNLVNLRVGLKSGDWRVEAFTENLTDEHSVTNLANITNLATPFPPLVADSIYGGLPNLRTYGARVSYKFGGAK